MRKKYWGSWPDRNFLKTEIKKWDGRKGVYGMSDKLDYRKVESKMISDGKFPTAIESEYRVHFNEQAHETMKQHASTTNEVELCGVLVGEVKRDSNGPFLLVHATIEGKNSNNHGAQVTFTHQTWDYINEVKDKQYANLKIVGWYHTHPGFGIFLSKMDLFIQENVFNLPFQVAVVLETKKNQIGCFSWVDGKCVPISRYWVGSQELKLTTGVVEEVEEPAMHSAAGAPAADRRTDYGGDNYPDSRSGFSMLTLLSLIIFFVCGVMIGKTLGGGDRNASLGSLESEVYSILEYAGMSSLAARDFSEVREKINTALAKMAAKEPGAEDTLKQTVAQLEAYEKTYARHRQLSREEMAHFIQGKRTLSDRINESLKEQDQLAEYTGNLYILRVMDILQKDGKPIELEKLSQPELMMLKKQIEVSIQLIPSAKEMLSQVHPGVFDFFYPKKKVEPDPKAPPSSEKK